MFVSNKTKIQYNTMHYTIPGVCQMLSVNQSLNLCLMTKLTLILSLNDPHDA